MDDLPIYMLPNGAFAFEADRDYDISVMKDRDLLNLNDYATAQNCMDALISMFHLEEYSEADARKIAAVRYNMKRQLVGDTDQGRQIRQRIRELKELIEAYRTAQLKELL